ALAIDSARKAVELRPDHPSGHRQLGWMLARAGRYEDAFDLFEEGLKARWPRGRFRGVERVLRGDLALVAAAWKAAAPDPSSVDARAREAGVAIASTPTLHVAAHWETDAT